MRFEFAVLTLGLTLFATLGSAHADPTPISTQNPDDPAGCYEIDSMNKVSLVPGTFSAPTQLKDGTIAIGTVDGKFLYINPLTLKIKTSIQLESSIFGKPLELADGRVVIGTDSGELYFIKRDGTFGKLNTLVRDGAYSGATALQGGGFAVTGYDQAIHTYDAQGNAIVVDHDKKGNPLTAFSTWGNLTGASVQLKDGTIVLGSTDRNIYFLNAKNQSQPIAQIQADSRFYAAPAILNDTTVVIGGDDGTVYYVDRTGIKAKYKTGGAVITAPLVIQDTVMVASGDGSIYFLDTTGKNLKTFPVNSRNFSEFDTDGTKVTFGGDNGYIYVFAPEGRMIATFQAVGAPWPGIVPPKPKPASPPSADARISELSVSSSSDDPSAVAPADRYFGRAQMSILGIRSILITISGQIDADPKNADHWLTSAEWTEEAIRDWENQFPQDPWLPRENFELAHVYERMNTPASFLKASNARTWLLARYGNSWFSRATQSKMSSEKITQSMLTRPIFLKGSDGYILAASEDHSIYLLQLTDKLFPCLPVKK